MQFKMMHQLNMNPLACNRGNIVKKIAFSSFFVFSSFSYIFCKHVGILK